MILIIGSNTATCRRLVALEILLALVSNRRNSRSAEKVIVAVAEEEDGPGLLVESQCSCHMFGCLP